MIECPAMRARAQRPRDDHDAHDPIHTLPFEGGPAGGEAPGAQDPKG